MNMFGAALALLKLVLALVDHVKRRRLIAEGERLQLARSLADVARAAEIAEDVRDEMERLGDEDLTRELMK
ncbi:MAG: hypothetical protein JJ902_23045 [Roseibium sp.]|nr:hypothetical protein [Roseibium sp.]